VSIAQIRSGNVVRRDDKQYRAVGSATVSDEVDVKSLLPLLEVADKAFDEKAVEGIWLLLFLQPENAQTLAIDDPTAESPEKLHVTVGTVDASTVDGKQEIVQQVIEEAASRLPPVVGKIGGYGSFVSNGDTVPIIALFDSPMLTDWRKQLIDTLQAVGVDVVQDHGYQPHITLAYAGSPVATKIDDREIVLDRLSLVWNGERQDYPLQGSEEQSMKEITVLVNDEQDEQLDEWEKDFLSDLDTASKEVTKRVGNQDLPASAFLVVGDPEAVMTWHLPVRKANGDADRRRIGAAWASLHGGYRGQKYAGPNKEQAITKLRKVYEDEEMPLPGTKEEEKSPVVEMDRALIKKTAGEVESQIKSEDEKAGRRVRGDKVGLVKKILSEFDDVKAALTEFLGWADYADGQENDRQENPESPEGFLSWLESNVATKALEDAEEHGSSFVAFKAADGQDWLLTFSTNAFEDREGEIFATKAIEEYVARHEDEDIKGEYQFWHLPGSKFGDILFQGMEGRFLVEAGPFDDTPTGRAFKEFFSENPRGHSVVAPDGWGCSHKYEYRSKDREDGVYNWFDKSETTVLPLYAAANEYTAPLFIKEQVQMNDRQKAALKLIGGDDLVSMVETVGKKATQELEETVGFKAGNYAAMVRKVAQDTEDEAVKAQLMSIASDIDDSYPEQKKKESDPEVEPEDEKAAGGPALGKRLRMLAGRLEGSAAAELNKIAASLMGGGEMEDDEEKSESKELTEFADAVGEGFKAVIEGYQTENAEVASAITALANAVKGVQEQIESLSRTDEAKIAEKAADTPAASLRDMVDRAIGSKDTRVDGRSTYAKDGPQQTQPVVDGQTGISLIDTFVSGADQKQLGR